MQRGSFLARLEGVDVGHVLESGRGALVGEPIVPSQDGQREPIHLYQDMASPGVLPGETRHGREQVDPAAGLGRPTLTDTPRPPKQPAMAIGTGKGATAPCPAG